MNQAQTSPPPDPAADVDALLARAETELAELDLLSTHDQVAAYDRVHDSLVQALARTTDPMGQPDGGPLPGRPGA